MMGLGGYCTIPRFAENCPNKAKRSRRLLKGIKNVFSEERSISILCICFSILGCIFSGYRRILKVFGCISRFTGYISIYLALSLQISCLTPLAYQPSPNVATLPVFLHVYLAIPMIKHDILRWDIRG